MPDEAVGCRAKLIPALGLGTVGIVNSAASPSTHSSFESPLFVALASTQAMSRPKADRRHILAIIDTNAMNVPQLGGLFARRPNAKETPHNVEPIDAPSSVAAARNDEKKYGLRFLHDQPIPCSHRDHMIGKSHERDRSFSQPGVPSSASGLGGAIGTFGQWRRAG